MGNVQINVNRHTMPVIIHKLVKNVMIIVLHVKVLKELNVYHVKLAIIYLIQNVLINVQVNILVIKPILLVQFVIDTVKLVMVLQPMNV